MFFKFTAADTHRVQFFVQASTEKVAVNKMAKLMSVEEEKIKSSTIRRCYEIERISGRTFFHAQDVLTKFREDGEKLDICW